MKNIRIRTALLDAKMKQWELADALGVSEYTMCKRLRKELPKEEQEKIIRLIQERKAV